MQAIKPQLEAFCSAGGLVPEMMAPADARGEPVERRLRCGLQGHCTIAGWWKKRLAAGL